MAAGLIRGLIGFVIVGARVEGFRGAGRQGHARHAKRSCVLSLDGSSASVEVLTDGGALDDRLRTALESVGRRVHLVGPTAMPGGCTAAGEPIFAVVHHIDAFAGLVRAVPAERRADLVLLGESSALLLSRLDQLFTPVQQGQLTIGVVDVAVLLGKAAAQPAVVRGRHAAHARAALAALGVPCDPAGARAAEAAEVRLCEVMVARSALWLVCAAAELSTPAELAASPVWLAELRALVATELLPATRRLATGKAAHRALGDAEALVQRIVAMHGSMEVPVAGARRAWSERNGLLFSTEPDRSAQPTHRWLHCLAGQIDLFEPTGGSAGALTDAQVEPGAVLAALPGRVDASLERTVLLVVDAGPRGVNALVLNRPTPLEVGDALAGEVGRYEAFARNLVHAGGELGPGDSTPGGMNPVYWLHTCDWLPEARALSSCAFLGGDSEMLAAAVAVRGSLDPSRIRFFWKHRAFRPGELDAQLSRGCWRRLPPHAWQAAC